MRPGIGSVFLLATLLAPPAVAEERSRPGSNPGALPKLVFVSRQRAPATTNVLGLGPRGRTLAPGGRLMLRETGGSVHPLLPAGTFYDVSDPCVSWDGRRILFAGVKTLGDPWRIWVVDADGKNLRRATDDAAAPTHDDLDPCWLPDDRICFASTRWPQRAQPDDLPVTNLFVGSLGVGTPERITSERNGGEEPSVDPRNGRVVYARWWFNRFLPCDGDPRGVTVDPAHAVPRDTIDLWIAASITPDGDGIRLAGGNPRERASLMAQQPAVLRDGGLAVVFATNRSMTPSPGATGIQVFEPGLGPARRVAGPGSPLGGRACAPVALPDGRLLFAWCPDGVDDFGLYVESAAGGRVHRVVDLPGTHELDAAVLAPRPRPPVLPIQFAEPPSKPPATRVEDLRDPSRPTFRFDCLNVFANGGVDLPIPDAPAIASDVRIRFFSVVSRPDAAGGDSLVLLKEAAVEPSGAVHVDAVPADVPLFEQLVDAQGRVLRAPGGPAHVPGFNFARAGAGTKCIGCHTGHSFLPTPSNYWKAKWINISPSATVTCSSLGAGDARGVVDRRTRGAPEAVGWVAAGTHGEWVRLQWDRPVEVRAVVLYALRTESAEGTNVRVREAEISFLSGDREVKRLTVRRELEAGGTRIDCDPVRVDAITVSPSRVTGLVRRRPAAALAEIETIARLIED